MRWVSAVLWAGVVLAGCASPGGAPVTDTAVTMTAAATPVAQVTVTVPPPTRSPTFTPTATNTPTATPTSTPTGAPTHTPTATPLPEVVVHLVGDVMLARAMANVPPAQVFAGVPVLAQAEVLAVNLETALGAGGAPEPKAYTFLAPPLMAEALRLAGVDVASLANNHALDYGVAVLTQTRQLLNAVGVAGVGAGSNVREAHAPVIIEREGLRLAFLAYVDVPVETRSGFDTRTWTAGPDTPGVAWLDIPTMQADIAAARAQADAVIVLLHFGYEGRTEPSDRQRRQAQAAIEAGAVVVAGAHPHVLQAVERYQNGLIAYSLGNFVFDGFSGLANQSAVLSLTLTLDGVRDWTLIPVTVREGLPVQDVPR